MVLLHICGTNEWAAAGPDTYAPDAFVDDGFIHLSRPDQVERPANRFYTGRSDLVLLVIDARRLPAEALRWEPSAVPGERGELFPHLHAPLPRAAVVDVVDFAPGDDGRFDLPPDLA
ncbi:MAG: DUF952 domain-containing protein [Acidimicrobiia bacterium]|nr:DUF952 domain-containing protein [Acidimicrobiia bacterium]